MNDREPIDPLPALRAEIEQAAKNAPDVARLANAVYTALVDEGFTSPQALWLTACNFGWLKLPEIGDDDE